MTFRRIGVAPLVLALSAGTTSAGDLPQIKTRGAFRVLVAADEQPEMFNFSTSGEPGFERELVEGFTRLHKLRLEPVSVARYDDRVPALIENKGDAILGIIQTEARRKLIDFTVETMPTRRLAVTLKPHRVLKAVEEFREEKIGILKGTTTWMSAAVEAGVPASRIQTFPDLEALFAAVRSGQVTATVMSISDLGLAKRKHPDLQAGVVLGAPGSAGWGVRKTDAALLSALNQYIDSVRKTPTWSRLIVKYFGEETLLVLGKAGEK